MAGMNARALDAGGTQPWSDALLPFRHLRETGKGFLAAVLLCHLVYGRLD